MIRNKKVSDLMKAVRKAGLTQDQHSNRWLKYRERKGVLVCPRDPLTKHRRFSDKEIKEIVQAFEVGGKGKWKPK